MRIESKFSHNLPGLLWFDLPLGIVLAFIFHTIVRDSLFNNLPLVLKSRLIKYTDFNWEEYFRKNWLVVIVSVLIGAFSHLLWDSFTHEHGYFVRLFQPLSEQIVVLGKHIPVYKILQHSSTLLGGLVILFALSKIKPDNAVSANLNRKYWAIFTLFTGVIIAFRFANGLNLSMYGHFVVTVISSVLISLVLTSWLMKKEV